jgi:hypothetical protein
MEFDSFVAIDWSGSRSLTHGIQIAECEPGSGPPRLVHPMNRTKWRRSEVRDWIVSRIAEKGRLLVGFDFAFAYPFCDRKGYFPGHPDSPCSARSLWNAVETICSAAPDLYGGPFYTSAGSPFANHLCYQRYTGNMFEGSRMRQTEIVCKRMGAKPSSVFKCVGPGSVGAGSVAGMRLLHFFSKTHEPNVCIWPFQTNCSGKSLLVEIFPSHFYAIAGCQPPQWQDRDTVNKVLEWFNSDGLPLIENLRLKDQADALVCAAAMRFFSKKSEAWEPAEMDDYTRRLEGWIFGVF